MDSALRWDTCHVSHPTRLSGWETASLVGVHHTSVQLVQLPSFQAFQNVPEAVGSKHIWLGPSWNQDCYYLASACLYWGSSASSSSRHKRYRIGTQVCPHYLVDVNSHFPRLFVQSAQIPSHLQWSGHRIYQVLLSFDDFLLCCQHYWDETFLPSWSNQESVQ